MSLTNTTSEKQINAIVHFSFSDLMQCILSPRTTYKKVRGCGYANLNMCIACEVLGNQGLLFAKVLAAVILVLKQIFNLSVVSCTSTLLLITHETSKGVKAVLAPRLLQSPY